MFICSFLLLHAHGCRADGPLSGDAGEGICEVSPGGERSGAVMGSPTYSIECRIPFLAVIRICILRFVRKILL